MKNLFNTSTSYLLLATFFCLLLLILRIKITNSLYMVFLIWNLFLAFIPYLISKTLNKRIQKTSKFKLILALFVWLLFLPNAPYIITDFIHLQHSVENLVWLDIFILFSFSLTGIFLAITSLLDIHKIIQQKWNSKLANLFSILATYLCGFGIYLGRFLRLNSWDFFTSPLKVIKQSLVSTNDIKTWFITFSFGSFLYILFLGYQRLEIKK
ncbi:DUF1361 domain-containing protein [Polaribacter sp.]|uniref:DUF1361 domain-containing protein n=1 Tax=Polaribacter sp. TaxID=1920175 RepID=UPI003F6A705C